MELEELLNKLIQMGWKPRGEKLNWMNFEHEKWNKRFVFWWEDKSGTAEYNEYSLRDLVSMESWLWEFVCEKRLYNKDKYYQTIEKWYVFTTRDYEYRLMLSSIQENIEKFLLDNILLPTK